MWWIFMDFQTGSLIWFFSIFHMIWSLISGWFCHNFVTFLENLTFNVQFMLNCNDFVVLNNFLRYFRNIFHRLIANFVRHLHPSSFNDWMRRKKSRDVIWQKISPRYLKYDFSKSLSVCIPRLFGTHLKSIAWDWLTYLNIFANPLNLSVCVDTRVGNY